MKIPDVVFVSVHKKRKAEVGLAYTPVEREAIGDVGSEEWARVRYVRADETDGVRRVKVDSRLLAECGDWSQPLQVRWVTGDDGDLVMTFRTPEDA